MSSYQGEILDVLILSKDIFFTGNVTSLLALAVLYCVSDVTLSFSKQHAANRARASKTFLGLSA